MTLWKLNICLQALPVCDNVAEKPYEAHTSPSPCLMDCAPDTVVWMVYSRTYLLPQILLLNTGSLVWKISGSFSGDSPMKGKENI